MISHERVTAVIEGRRPDRIPVYGWGRANLAQPITDRFGSVEAFEDRGLLLGTSHFVEDPCDIDELVFTYDLIHALVHESASGGRSPRVERVRPPDGCICPQKT